MPLPLPLAWLSWIAARMPLFSRVCSVQIKKCEQRLEKKGKKKEKQHSTYLSKPNTVGSTLHKIR